MDANLIEEAYLSLRALLDRDGLPEDAFQDFFEAHPVVWECLGYVKAEPKPQLKRATGESLYPDFMLQTPESTWQIADLKLPSQSIVKKKRNRDTFYAPIHEGFAQLDEYAAYFGDLSHQQWFLQNRGAEIGYRPRCLLVVGRTDASRAAEDGLEREYLLQNRTRTAIYTYDDILNRLVVAQANAVGVSQAAHALTWSMKARIPSVTPGRRNYLVDHVSRAGDGWRAFFDANAQPNLQVFDTSGTEFSTAAASFPFGSTQILSFLFASSDRHSVLQIVVDGITVSLQRWPDQIAVGQLLDGQLHDRRTTTGNSLNGKEGVPISLWSVAAWSTPLSFLDLIALNEEWLPT